MHHMVIRSTHKKLYFSSYFLHEEIIYDRTYVYVVFVLLLLDIILYYTYEYVICYTLSYFFTFPPHQIHTQHNTNLYLKNIKTTLLCKLCMSTLFYPIITINLLFYAFDSCTRTSPLSSNCSSILR